MPLRDYQQVSITGGPMPHRPEVTWPGVIASLRQHRSTLVVCFTGGGKTEILMRLSQLANKRVMLLAERRKLVRQTHERIEAATRQRWAMEMGDEKSSEWGTYLQKPKGIVGCVQSIVKRLGKWRPEDFGLVIIDEAHHAAAESYRKIIDHFRHSKVVGFTATPDRHDEQPLVCDDLFQSVAFSYSLPDGQEDGWLVPFEQRVMDVSVDLSGIKVNKQSGDFNQAAVAQQVNTNKALYEVAGETIKHQGDRPTIVFAQDVAQAEELSNIINDAKRGSAAWIAYTLDDDLVERRIREFKQGGFQTLCNVGICAEGFDHPPTSCIVIGAPTASRSRYAQWLGRGSRPVRRDAEGTVVDGLASPAERVAAIAASAKPECLILDFTDCSDSHKLVHPADVLSPTDLTDRERRKVQEIARRAGTEDVKAIIAKAKQLATEEEEELKRRRLEIVVPTHGSYRAPHQGGSRLKHRSMHGSLTQKQLARLRQQGYPIDAMNTSELHKAWGDFVYRIKANKPSKAQENALKRFKVPVPATKKEASELLDRCFSRGRT